MTGRPLARNHPHIDLTLDLLLINPASDAPTYFGAEAFAAHGFGGATLIADLALPTLAALASPYLSVTQCDESVDAIDPAWVPRFVGITGKVSQRGRMIAIAREFRRRGSIVIIGGPYASLDPDGVREHCDVLVRGEIEPVADLLFADLRSGRWRAEYVGEKADLADCPLPAWSGYTNERALMGAVQTSRGCPFDCEFCDVIQYLGRRQRHKPLDRVLAELDQLYALGYRRVTIADDNFTATRSRARELLHGIADWNARHGADRMTFVTQVSVDVTRDEEMLALCAAAGLNHVFVGLETPNEESLREAHKPQNLRGDLVEQVERFLAHGVTVTAGMIVGFDADDRSIFERQYAFAMRTGVPLFSLGALMAPVATPLHARMAAAGRLVPDTPEIAATPWTTNIVPAQMSREELLLGLRWLCNKLYDADAFGDRLMRQIDLLPPVDGAVPAESASAPSHAAARPVADTMSLIRQLPRLGVAEARMWSRVRRRLRERPDAAPHVLPAVLQYVQIRHMYDVSGLWDPALARLDAPPFACDNAPEPHAVTTGQGVEQLQP